MKKSIVIAAAAVALLSASSFAAPFTWVNGKVTSFTAQLPMFTVAMVNNKAVRFCDPASGADYAVNSTNVQFDMLLKAFLHNKNVQVGVHDFGQDPQAGIVKLCIDRVILTH